MVLAGTMPFGLGSARAPRAEIGALADFSPLRRHNPRDCVKTRRCDRGLRQLAAAVGEGSLLPVARSKMDARLLHAARSKLRPPHSGSKLPHSTAPPPRRVARRLFTQPLRRRALAAQALGDRGDERLGGRDADPR